MRNLLTTGKKGNLNLITPAILTLVLAAVLVVFGVVITQELRDVPQLNDYTGTVSNETGVNIDAAGYTVASATQPGFHGLVITAAWNATDGKAITVATNITVANSSSTIYAATGQNWTSGAKANIAYTYISGGQAYRSANETLIGLASITDFWEIIVLAVVIAVVIGLLLVVFSQKRVG